MKIFYCDILAFPLPEEQDFLIDKYELMREEVLAGGIVTPQNLLLPPEATPGEIARVHSPDYVQRLRSGDLSEEEIREVGLPWSRAIVERAIRTAGATVATCRFALTEGIAVHLGGGTHHAFADRGRGFCWLNDCAIAAAAMLAEGRAKRVMILDCDVHQGDGTAAIFQDNTDVFTVSIHGGYSYPYHKRPADLDIELPVGSGDAYYLETLDEGLDVAMDRFSPDLVIYLAGADVYAHDRFGCLALSQSGIARRDRLVLERFAGNNIPVAVTLAGGYARQLEEAVEIHLQTVRIAAEYFESLHSSTSKSESQG